MQSSLCLLNLHTFNVVLTTKISAYSFRKPYNGGEVGRNGYMNIVFPVVLEKKAYVHRTERTHNYTAKVHIRELKPYLSYVNQGRELIKAGGS